MQTANMEQQPRRDTKLDTKLTVCLGLFEIAAKFLQGREEIAVGMLHQCLDSDIWKPKKDRPPTSSQ